MNFAGVVESILRQFDAGDQMDEDGAGGGDPLAAMFGDGINFGGGQIRFGQMGGIQFGPMVMGGGGRSFEDLLHHIMEQYEGPVGNPPATQASVDGLKKGRADAGFVAQHKEEQCSVCQDDWAVGDEFIAMPCGHAYHPDCLLPWLKEHNSCPTCRHELPTDDADYERMRRQQQHPGR